MRVKKRQNVYKINNEVDLLFEIRVCIMAILLYGEEIKRNSLIFIASGKFVLVLKQLTTVTIMYYIFFPTSFSKQS